jgi:hypothetical protein
MRIPDSRISISIAIDHTVQAARGAAEAELSLQDLTRLV